MIALVLGGVRSGKSEVAESLAARRGGPVTYVATGGEHPDDPDWAARVAAHRARRPRAWSTVEVPAGAELGPVLAGLSGTALVDSLGTWLAGREGAEDHNERLCTAVVARAGDTVLVSEEVGLGVHPVTRVGRRFRDDLGALNRAVAEVAEEVLLVVAGRVLPLSRWDGGGRGGPAA
ncbi:MAG TPA: bifunctional adenosylcobinamide kinase/adenosylcobinamide-phosphate guanylyltransferase [Acidimicrobiales bacterium]|nr:bifunctional adenosylcobinamide kinase/adenosylcobinamide-phosphate guanylyltransferase [Acidimicrobiales bacterium]